MERKQTPWGRITALLAACCVTLIGVIRGLDPDLVLFRALAAALVIGTAVSIAARVVAYLGAAGDGRSA